jgi:hypothetical protein
MQGNSASWAPQCMSATQTQGTSATQTQGTSARPQVGHPNAMQDGRPNAKLIRNENVHKREHWAKRRAGGWIRTNFGLEVDFLIRPHQVWAPQLNARHVRKMGAQTQHKACPQVGCPNATKGTSASCAPQRTSATQRQGTSACPQIGRPNATQGTSVRWLPKRKTHLQRKRPHKGALG